MYVIIEEIREEYFWPSIFEDDNNPERQTARGDRAIRFCFIANFSSEISRITTGEKRWNLGSRSYPLYDCSNAVVFTTPRAGSTADLQRNPSRCNDNVRSRLGAKGVSPSLSRGILVIKAAAASVAVHVDAEKCGPKRIIIARGGRLDTTL